MLDPEEPTLIPISLTLDQRTGYSIWASPWFEDAEEWQAFLGNGSKVYVFEELDDLSAFLSSDARHDLRDHPQAAMLETLPSDQLIPEGEYRFDLDAVALPQEQMAERHLIERSLDAVDTTRRIAECCDDSVLITVLESLTDGIVHGDNGPIDVDSDEVARTLSEIQSIWPQVTKRLRGLLEWHASVRQS